MAPQELFTLLKKGLQSTIDQFPFIMGSLMLKNDMAAKGGALEIHINPESGVQFGYRNITETCNMTFESLQSQQFALKIIEDAELQILPSPDEIDRSPHKPVFIAQATFIPGGVILFFAHSHQITDVTGTNAIMKCWSENMVAAADGLAPRISEPLRQASVQVDRHRLDDTTSVTNITPHLSFPMVIEDTPPPSPRQRPYKSEQNPSLIWHMSVKSLEKLKEFASPEQGEGYISTLDAVNALFWRAICRSRQLSEGTVSDTKMFFVCDIRTKLSPPLRQDSTCNAAMKLHATQSWTDLLDRDLQKSLCTAATSVRQAICNFEPRMFEAWIAYVKSAPSFWSLKNKERLTSGPDIVVTDHSKVSVYKYVWGPLGQTKRIRNPWWNRSSPKPFSQVTLMPRLENGDLEILTNLSQQMNERMLEDQELAQFVAFRCG